MKKILRVDLQNQWIKEKNKLLPAIKKTLESGGYVNSKIIYDLEKKLAKYNNAKYCVCTNSGTDALTLALYILGVKNGDEVITPPNSFIASTASIAHLKARPIFCDVNNQQVIDEKIIENLITKKTKVIMPVHLCGRMANMIAIKKIAKKYKLKIVEDCAQAIGSKLFNKKSGTYGDIGCFSTHPLKNLNACGDGGFIITNNYQYYKKIKNLINHGLVSRDKASCFAYVSRMDSIQAAILLERLKTLDDRIIKKRKVAEIYFKKLKNLPIILPLENKNEFNTYHLFVIQTNKRNSLMSYLKRKGIETGIHYPIPIHKQMAFKKMSDSKKVYKKTESQAKSILSLPVNEFLKKKEVYFICKSIHNFFYE